MDTSREARRQELNLRCFVARGKIPDQATVIGIATETPEQDGHSLDLVMLYIRDWTKEAADQAEKMQRDLGYFVSTRVRRSSEDEYPET